MTADDNGAPLSFAQARFWFLDQLGAGAALNVPMAFRVAGPLDVAALGAALCDVQRRHAILRTSFPAPDGTPVQRVASEATLVPPLIDRPDEAALLAHAREESELPFDLACGPLVRAALARLGPEDHTLLLTAHHAAWDRGSTGILFRELAAHYASRAAGSGPGALPPLPLQHAEHAARQRAAAAGPELDGDRAWWRARLAGLEPLELPADRPRPAVQGYRSAVHDRPVPPGVARELAALAARTRATTATLLGAAYLALLARTTGRTDLSFGLPASHRTRPELEPMIGPLLNSLVVRADLAGDPSFAGELVPRVREAMLGALEHQTVPFEVLVADLAPPRDTSRHPLYQVGFSLLAERREVLHLGIARIAPLGRGVGGPEMVDPSTLRTPLDLELRVLEHQGGLLVRLIYDVDLFDAERVERLADGLLALLTGIAARPGTRLSELPLIAPAEHARLIAPASPAAPRRPFVAAHQRALAHAQRDPQRIALLAADGTTTYGELGARVERLRSALVARGVEHGEVAAVLLERSPDSVVATLAVLAAGGAFLPLDPGLPRRRIAWSLDDARARAVVTRREHLALLAGTGVPPVHVSDTPDAAAPCVRAARNDDAAYLLYTSGSTAAPKGVLGLHGGLANRLDWDEEVAPWEDGEVACHKTPTAFVDHVAELLGPLAAGVPVLVLDDATARDPEALVVALAAHEVTRLVLVPSHLALLLEVCPDLGARLPRLLRWTVSGEPLPARLAARFHAAAPRARLRNLYGSTETAADATALDVDFERLPAHGVVPVGRPITNIEVRVLDAWGQPAPVGVPGEILVGGAGLAAGYWRRPGETAARFVPHPYDEGRGTRIFRTGDRGARLPDGSLAVLGRLDDQLKLRGVRIEPREVEAALLADGRVVAAAATVRAGPGGDARLIACVVARGAVTAEELLARARATLPPVLVPSGIAFADTLPRTPSGKVDRRALPDPPRPVGAPAGAHGSAGVLRAILAELLDDPALGVEDDFFAHGGHSLLAARAAARARDALGVDVAVRDLFAHPTAAGLAAALAERAPRGRDVETPPASGDAPASFAQERLFVLDALGAGAAANLPLALALRGGVAAEEVERALAALVARHAALRTALALVDGALRQHVAAAAPVPLSSADLGDVAPAERDDRLRRLAAADAAAPFDLAVAPLWRARLVRLDAAETVLLLTFHHAICDAWSLGILRAELAALLAGAPLPPPPPSYAELARRQRARLTPQVRAHAVERWRSRLAGLEVLDVPSDHPRPPRRSYRTGAHELVLPDALADQLRALARTADATFAMLLLAAWQALLARLTDRGDVAVGMPVAARPDAAMERAVGPFVNLLVVRTDLHDDPRFADALVPRVRAAVLAALDDQDLPFEELVRALDPPRDPGRHPLAQVAFTLQNAPRAEERLEPLALATQPTLFDLELRVLDRPGDVPARLLYDRALFEPATVAALAGRLLRVLAHVAAHPGDRLSALPVLDERERDSVAVSGPPCAAAETVVALALQQAARSPERVAVSCARASWTYGELERRSAGLARRLAARGVAHGDLVGVCLPRGVELPATLLAIHRAGAAYLPLDAAEPAPRLAAKIAGARPRLVLATDETRAHLPDDVAVLRPDGAPDEARLAAPPAPGDLAYAIHTSGSTGVPKAVAVEHRSLANLLLHVVREIDLRGDDVLLAVTSVAFDIAALELLAPLCVGGRVAVAPREASADPAVLARALETSGATVCQATPTTWRMLVASGWRAPRPLRALCGGETLPPELARALLEDPHVSLFNLYGPTETTIWSTIERVRAAPGDARLPIGRPVSGTLAYVVDRFGELLPAGAPGELWIGGAGVARGYIGDPELTAARFRSDPFREEVDARVYRTGDRARLRADGRLEHLGRIDWQVKVRGHRVEPGEIEAALAAHPGVVEAVVTAGARDGAVTLVAFYVALGDARPTAAELRAFLAERLPPAFVPGLLFRLAALPRGATGKVDRAALPELPEAGEARPNEPPRGPIEGALARIWKQALGIGAVDRRDRFLDLGGHSLLALAVVAQIEQELGVRVRPLDLLFSDLAQLAAACAPDEDRSWVTRLLRRAKG